MEITMRHPVTHRLVSLAIALVGLCAMTSCTEQVAIEVPPRETIPFTSLTEVKLDLDANSGPAIVEFAQDYNCARCDQMAETMSNLRAGFSKDVVFHRVNFLSANNEMKLSLCPTYLLMLDGEVIDRLSGKQPYPILASRLDGLVAVHKRRSGQQTNPSAMELRNDTLQQR